MKPKFRHQETIARTSLQGLTLYFQITRKLGLTGDLNQSEMKGQRHFAGEGSHEGREMVFFVSAPHWGSR